MKCAKTHPKSTLTYSVISISDTRTPQTDHSGQWLVKRFQQEGHQLQNYQICPDEPKKIQQHFQKNINQHIDLLLLTGGSGIAPRDITPETIEPYFCKKIPGFGELFRFLSYQEIGTNAILSRASAGIVENQNHYTAVFLLPGSTSAVQLATEQLILPQLPHIFSLLSKEKNHHPPNLSPKI
ncbi:MAG: MogA/MoaB family molybdenum cofactor biosynthesis protein [Planctomycetota bacterium]|nr:MAG: MogA/MoaB family molybdenum cofactor biosynthesis protein [Planctomycetota bacterium]